MLQSLDITNLIVFFSDGLLMTQSDVWSFYNAT
jgi:hypothetical protein